jgi:sulfonate transport system substrate-binding protein
LEDAVRTRTRTSLGAALVIGLLATLLVGCGTSSEAEKSKSTPDKPAAQAVATKVPAGTTLRVGDQLDYLKTVLSLSGQDKDLPYKLEYSSFIGGPPMLQAFQAGAIDTGFVGSTPLIFAQAADQDISAIAGWASQGGSYSVLTAPGKGSIKSWKDLEGQRVVYQQGTAGEAAILEGLDSANLSLSDITPVNVPITQTSAALQSGSSDAGISVEPLTSTYLAQNPSAKQIARAQTIVDRSSFLIATQDALDDSAKAAALGDLITRLVKSFTYLQAHPELVTSNVYVKQYGLTPERAKQVQTEVGPTSFLTLPGDVSKAQQRLADLFHAAGEIPDQIDVSSEFDARYTDIVKAALNS